jgi:allophanate hydrolase subunit 2
LLAPTPRTVPIGLSVPESLRPQFGRSCNARVVLGPYDHRFKPESIAMLTEETWRLTPVADRTGFRFDGDEKFQFNPREQPFGAGSDASNIVDAGYPMGSIQVPGGGQPIVLHRDAVSAGGYAAIATVISADLDVIGQLAPKSTAKFEIISIDDALVARAESKRRRQRTLAAISA